MRISISAYIVCIAFIIIGINTYAQPKETDANIFGHVLADGQHLAYANVFLKNTTIGTTTDETGHFKLVNLPEGKYTIRVQALGYKPSEKELQIVQGITNEINFDIEPDILGLEEVTITGNRNEINRKESPVIVNTLSAADFNLTQSSILSEGLNFTPGIRVENNCQNCGFNQVRMNGMEGPYSQILINSRPIFSGLAGVYGLELIPTNMIERIEVVRGGGSALYGSNAIAGTINIILKDPINNNFEFGTDAGLIGMGLGKNINPASDFQINMNANIVGEDNKSGMSVYGFHRERNPFDANSDSFSELSKINNLTAGARFFYKTGSRGKLSIDYFMINETRRGGNKFEMPLHETDIAEALTHNISSAACTYEQFYRKHDKLSLYISGQRVKRDSYYGALQSLKDYGNTSDFTYALGAQYVANFNLTNITIGFENTAGWLLDKKLGYPVFENNISNITFHEGNTLIAHQMSITSGIYFQYNLHLEKLNVSAGGRLDNYSIRDFVNESDQTKSGYVLSPRLSVMYDINKYIQARINYSQGYRAPQIFDEDLHIETSGSRKVVHQNHPDLIQETSHSISTSIDYNYAYGNSAISFLTEGFYTILKNPFANSYGLPDTLGAVIYTRINSDGTAFVAGVNIEIKIIPNKKWLISSGYTYQHSAYSTPQEFNETQFLRTPNTYGFLTVDYKAFKHFGVSINGTNTGKMLVPYFGIQQENPNLGELRVTKAFYDIGLKLRYTIKLNSMCIQIFSGIKNILNSYQNDFDSGILRDPGYIYGPTQPRTIYLGFKLGNGKINI